MDTCNFNSYRKNGNRISNVAQEVNDHLSSVTDTSDDSDSSDDVQWKRQKKPKKLNNPLKHSALSEQTSVESKPKRNCVWSNVLTEQMLTENVSYCGIDTVTEKTRDVESYKYKKKNDEEHGSDQEKEEKIKPQNEIRPHNEKFGKANKNKLAMLLAKKLKEPKRHLIENVIGEVGKDKTLELYGRTMKIEANGGELTANGLRRRSPGGVFFMLLKSDPEIRKTQIDNIFKDEKDILKRRKKVIQSYKRRQKFLQLTQNLERLQLRSVFE